MPKNEPTRMPPSAEGAAGGAAAGDRPRDLNEADLALTMSAASAAPTQEPPRGASAAAGAAVGAWTDYTKITALWSINQNRNSWAYFDGKGWKKLSNASDSATAALTILAAAARETGTQYANGREEADGMIHELYVW